MKKYEIIYADPPWRYDFSKDGKDKIENHYPTMSADDICNIKIESSDNAVLYLWTTAPKLLEGLKVMVAWGFNYKTNAIWDKGYVGMGYWFRGQHELLLVGTKGKFSPPKDIERISSVLHSKKERHSAKPTIIRELISKWYPDKTKLEMFARPDERIDLWNKNTFDGWDVWGNEVENDITF